MDQDDALLRAVLDHESIGVAALSLPDFVFEMANPTFTALVGGRPLVGRRADEAFPDLAREFQELKATAAGTTQPWRREDQRFTFSREPGGPEITIYATFEVTRLRLDGTEHVMVTTSDTTERVRLNEELVRQRERLAEMLENISDAFLAVDREWCITFLNERGGHYVGVDPVDAIERSLWDVFSPLRGTVFETGVRAAMGERRETRFQMASPSGAWLDVRAYPTHEGIAVFGTDVSELRRSVEERERLLDEARALAVENSMLFEAEKRRLELAERMDGIDRVMHSSLDYDEVMQRALEEATKALGAKAGAVFILVEEGISEARYIYGFPRILLGRRLPGADFPFSRMMEETLEPVAVGTSQMATLMNPTIARMFGVRSLMAIPIIVRGIVTGGVGIVFDKPHEFDQPDIDFARTFGASLSLALENADLYRRQERVADTLQEALLTLPERVPGVEFAHVYHSAAEAARVGGDFYDVFELEHDTVGLTVGDISGKGLDAAVLTALVKNAVRAQATDERNSPGDVLEIVNKVLLGASKPESFATVFFGRLQVDDGSLSYCNGGHTASAIVRRRGGVEALPANSPLVGGFTGVPFHTETAQLGRGDILFLYTDGLIEARRDGELYGEERLFELLGRLHRRGPHHVADDVIREIVGFTNGQLSDDAAILAVRLV